MINPTYVLIFIAVLTQIFGGDGGECIVPWFGRKFDFFSGASPYVVSLIALAGVLATNAYTEKARRNDRQIEDRRREQDQTARELEMSQTKFRENQARQRVVISELIRALWVAKEKVQEGLEGKSIAIMEDGGTATPATNHHHDQMNALGVSAFYREAELLIELAELEIENSEVLKSLEKLKTLLRVESYSVIHEGDRRLEFLEWMEAAKRHAPFSQDVSERLEEVRKVSARALRGTVSESLDE